MPNGVVCSSYVQENCTGLQCLLKLILSERCEGCYLVAGAAATAEASLIEKVSHGWGECLQDDALQQLVKWLITCSKMWIIAWFCQGYDLRLSPDLWSAGRRRER